MQPSTRRRWFQFSTVGLLALMVLVAFVSAFVVVPTRRQHDAVQRILARGGLVTYDYVPKVGTPVPGPFFTPTPAGPEWLRAIVGDDYFQSVRSIDSYTLLHSADDVAELLRATTAFPKLKSLSLRCRTIDDAEMRTIGTLTSLEFLCISRDNGLDSAPLVSAVGLSHLSKLRELKYLVIDGSFSDEALAALSGLSKLRSLFIDAPITDRGMVHLQSLEKLETLWIGGPHYDLDFDTDIDFKDTPFSDVIDFYCNCLDMERDPSCERYLSSHEETKITLRCRGIQRDVIDRTLEQYGLGFRITNRRFGLTSRAEAIEARKGITDLRKRLPNLTDVRVAW